MRHGEEKLTAHSRPFDYAQGKQLTAKDKDETNGTDKDATQRRNTTNAENRGQRTVGKKLTVDRSTTVRASS
jgi:hypothetical protein